MTYEENAYRVIFRALVDAGLAEPLIGGDIFAAAVDGGAHWYANYGDFLACDNAAERKNTVLVGSWKGQYWAAHIPSE